MEKWGLRRRRRKIAPARELVLNPFQPFEADNFAQNFTKSPHCHIISRWFRFIGKAVTVSQVFRKLTSHFFITGLIIIFSSSRPIGAQEFSQ